MNHLEALPTGMRRCPQCGSPELNAAKICSCCGFDFSQPAVAKPNQSQPANPPIPVQSQSPTLQPGPVQNSPPPVQGFVQNPNVSYQGSPAPNLGANQSNYGYFPVHGMTTPNPSNLTPEAQAAAMQLDAMTAQAAQRANMAMAVLTAEQYGNTSMYGYGGYGYGGIGYGGFRNPYSHRYNPLSWLGNFIP